MFTKIAQCIWSPDSTDEKLHPTTLPTGDVTKGATWPDSAPTWSQNPDLNQILREDKTISESQLPATVNLSEIIDKSIEFAFYIPEETVQCQYLQSKIPKEVLEYNANSSYPLMHEHVLYLCAMFLDHQKRFGSQMYREMSLLQLIDRLVTKRAVMFVGPHDHYWLLDGTDGVGGWEAVGTSDEKPPLTAEGYMTYDEIKLAALLSVSSHTVFINDGSRHNSGIYEENRQVVQDGGVIVGLVGARLRKKHVMEYRDMVKTPEQNKRSSGYGRCPVPSVQGIFTSFYQDVPLTFKQLERQNAFKNSDRFVDISRKEYFDCWVYARRIALSIDTLLIEANDRASKVNKMAYVHVVGVGLGVWRLSARQDVIFMDTFAARLEFLGPKLTNISDTCLAYMRVDKAGNYSDGDKIGNIKLHIRKREPHERLSGEDQDKLLVVSYATDGNALPGNEFWCGSATTSGDPAAACSTQIAELHNPHINPLVCAANLRIATLEGKVVTFGEYQAMHKGD